MTFDPLVHSTPARVRRTRITPRELVAETGFDVGFYGVVETILGRRGYPFGFAGARPELTLYTKRWDDIDGTVWVEWVPR